MCIQTDLQFHLKPMDTSVNFVTRNFQVVATWKNTWWKIMKKVPHFTVNSVPEVLELQVFWKLMYIRFTEESNVTNVVKKCATLLFWKDIKPKYMESKMLMNTNVNIVIWVLSWRIPSSNIWSKSIRKLNFLIKEIHSVLEQIWIKGSHLCRWLPQGERGPPKES